MLDCSERLACIKGIFEIAGEKIETRKKLHKLVYLLQELGIELNQDFTFHHYGVFSPTLANDLSLASAEDTGFLEESRDSQGAYVYELKQTSESNTESIVRSFVSEEDPILRDLVSKQPRYLEVLSTIVYLYRNHYRGERLVAKLKELKPDLGNYFDEAFQQAKEIYDFSIKDDV